MRSGNGRHRRPRQAPALFVAAGVTSAGIAIPLLGATGAHAADAATWDRVAQCESDGVWSAKGSGGHYGGLRLTQEMWDQYGGTSLAERPDLASRSQQIAVAEKILQARGAEAFGDCGDSAGLDKAKGDPGVDPGDGSARSGGYPAPAPSEDAASGEDTPDKGSADPDEHGDSQPDDSKPDDSKPDDSKSGKPDDSTSDKPDDGPSSTLPSDPAEGPVTPENPDDTPDPSDSAKPSAPGKGKHRGQPEDHASHGEHPSGDSDDSDDSDGSGGPGDGRASRHDDRDRRTSGKHRVQPGDSLSRIAADEDVRGGWPELYERNKDEVGPDPDLIHPGQTLRL